ncbi:hypothetical protein [Agrococcus sp. ARC_14]|uniref:hypothetical protein n=1 Tax=Agrococcus sp. ARC_14 TaxID=2919927 RepID=UPI001F050A4B|nr:hypothetical protein [Agrococcus sp. ARC_14]MCH1882101.1 hypothetical protein [Agrococcus sp. ARC_14]
MPWVDVAAWVLVLGATAVIIALGPRIWHSASVQRSRRMGGLGVFDEIWRPATYEQRIAEERAAEAGDSIEQLEPKRPSSADVSRATD